MSLYLTTLDHCNDALAPSISKALLSQQAFMHGFCFMVSRHRPRNFWTADLSLKTIENRSFVLLSCTYQM